MAKPIGPFGGYKTRQEQLDAQEKAAGALMPEEPEEMEPAAPPMNGARRKKVDNYPWD